MTARLIFQLPDQDAIFVDESDDATELQNRADSLNFVYNMTVDYNTEPFFVDMED